MCVCVNIDKYNTLYLSVNISHLIAREKFCSKQFPKPFGISEMSDEEETASQLTDKQKIEIAKWFLLNSPAGEIQYVAKGNLAYS